MTCGGCSGAVERALKKATADGALFHNSSSITHGQLSHAGLGVDSYDVSLEKQEVIVKGSIPYDTLLEKIKKTGKEVRTPALLTMYFELTGSLIGSLGPDRRVNAAWGRVQWGVCNIVYK